MKNRRTLALAVSMFCLGQGHLAAEAKSPGLMQKLENISYWPGADASDRAHLLSLFTPKDKEKEKSFPLIIYVHGGAWTARPNPGTIPAWVPQFVKSGYAVAVVNYRLAQEGIFSSQMEDLNCALRYLKSNADKLHVDGGHIGLWGTSAGGHLVALMGTSAVSPVLNMGGDQSVSRDVQAVCDMAGPTNLFELGTKVYPLKQWDTSTSGASLSLLLGGTAASQIARALEASPDTYVSPANPPFLIIHGINDAVVPVEQSDLLAEKLQKAGVKTTYMRLPKSGHDVEKGRNIDAALHFFDQYLKAEKGSK